MNRVRCEVREEARFFRLQNFKNIPLSLQRQINYFQNGINADVFIKRTLHLLERMIHKYISIR
ncbi:MAG: hypothetical protein C4323_02810 [Mastigocladus sp. ERB_26_2]